MRSSNTIQPFSNDSHSEVTQDFGRLQTTTPLYVAQPTCVEEVQQAIIFAIKNKLSLAVRGHAHSTGGQPLAERGIVVDLKQHLHTVSEPQRETNNVYSIDIQAGASWRNVFDVCLPNNLTPPTYSDYIELTTGGTISSGGVGQSSFKKGLQVDNVLEMDVVTGTGELVTCSEQENPELFNFVKNGFGHFGIITRIKMQLEQAPKKVLLCKCVYFNAQEFLHDQMSFADRLDIDAIQAHIVLNDIDDIKACIGENLCDGIQQKSNDSDNNWAYILEVTKYIHEKQDSSEVTTTFKRTVADGCTSLNTNLKVFKESSFASHVTRVPPILDNGYEKGKPAHHHCCVFIPKHTAVEFITETLKISNCANTGKGTILVIPLKSDVIHSHIMLPKSEQFYLVAFLRRHFSSQCTIDNLEVINDKTYHLAVSLGGTIYPCGSGEYLKKLKCWQQHYGGEFNAIQAAKNLYDPNKIFCPSMPITGF